MPSTSKKACVIYGSLVILLVLDGAGDLLAVGANFGQLIFGKVVVAVEPLAFRHNRQIFGQLACF